MLTIEEKFKLMATDSAPGQEVRAPGTVEGLSGDPIEGVRVDFSHGDVDAHPPIPGSLALFDQGFEEGAPQAYTEYRGRAKLRAYLSGKLAEFSGAPVDADSELIVTPGTQGALFLAMGVNIMPGDKVALIEPDYFANRKLITFFGGELVPIRLDYFGAEGAGRAGLVVSELERAFADGVKLFIFSNPNNPAGCLYSREEVTAIGELAEEYGVKVIADELYARQIFDGREYTHLRGLGIMDPENLVTIIGPSKTESMSGFRLGVAYGSPSMIVRMEKLQAIVSLRAAGYCQAVIPLWFSEPEGWMDERIAAHAAIRDDIVAEFRSCPGVRVRATEGGSYVFPQLPALRLGLKDFVTALRVQANVIVTLGTEFGPQFTDSIRLNFSQDHGKAMDAVRRICQMIDRYRA
ncbi:aminotransferase class I/II-fold pyridoxal phosphate-dependent enzyme [Coriobacteriales bacterium OH1046]|nr:aminotransferase class I/II-fold pyridoxal phosphate-dependent enzyme [Coriobacteriales bacterium OH1046]